MEHIHNSTPVTRREALTGIALLTGLIGLGNAYSYVRKQLSKMTPEQREYLESALNDGSSWHNISDSKSAKWTRVLRDGACLTISLQQMEDAGELRTIAVTGGSKSFIYSCSEWRHHKDDAFVINALLSSIVKKK